MTVSFASEGNGFVPFDDLRDSCKQFFEETSNDFDFELGTTCQRMWDTDEKVGSVIEELKDNDLWENTIVILTNFNPDDDKTIFSVGGGALPAHLVSSTNENLHSVIDIAPTIM